MVSVAPIKAIKTERGSDRSDSPLETLEVMKL